jgi:hypothetical protein
MADLTLSLTGANGDSITFDSSTYILATGLKGLGIPATKLRIQEAATDGGIFRHTKRGIREIDLPIVTVGTDRADTETKLRRLANILQNTSGATRLTATYANGDVFYLDGYYAGGAETVFGQDSGSTYASWMVVFQSPNPFWASLIPQQFTVTGGSTGRGLLPQLSKMKVSSAQQLGTVTLTNTGDVPCAPIWTVYGPIDNLSITVNGVGFAYVPSITAGQIITFNNGAVTDSAGNNLYANLASAPKFFTLPPGTTSISVAGINTTAATKVVCQYFPNREVIH